MSDLLSNRNDGCYYSGDENMVKLGEKGQITLPQSIRDNYQWVKGTQFRVIDQGDGMIAIVPVQPAKNLHSPVFTFDKVSEEQMDEAIASGASEIFK